MHELKPHQIPMMDYARPLSRIAFFVSMRLGKSVVTIRWAESRKEEPLVLVVSYLSPIYGWVDELKSENLKSMLLTGEEKKWKEKMESEIDAGTRWFIINPERLLRSPWLLRLPWDVLIIDESTMIRNPRARITRLLVDGKLKAEGAKVFRDFCPDTLKAIKYRAVLTGTPDPEDPMDFCEQCRFLWGEFMGYRNYWAAQEKLFNRFDYDWVPKSGTLQSIRNYMRSRCYFLTSKQAGVVFPRVRQTRYVELPASLRKQYKDVEETMSMGDQQTMWATTQHQWLAEIAGGLALNDDLRSNHKADELLEIGKELRNEQIIVWFRFNRELDAFAEILDMREEKYTTITGEVTAEDREANRQLFQTKKVRWLLGQAQCAKFGLNLSAASVMVWFSRWHEALPNIQAAERAFHLSKTETVLEIDLITKDTIDEDVREALSGKACSSAYFKQRMTNNLKRRLAK